MSDNEQSKSRPQGDKRTTLIRYGKIPAMGWFENKAGEILKTKTKVVIKTARGLEIGDVVGPFCYKHGNFKCSKQQTRDYYPERTKEYPLSGGGVMVRYATEEDLMEAEHLDILAKDELKTCQKMADDMKLTMKIVDAEHLLGGERIVFYFLSEHRIDFRELVKNLARELHTRIELRQIGSRDEARLIGDYESCGLECCCRSFLKILAPVNMRMAKVQKATLDPSKISGHCGRLKCCLRYEDETYKALKKNLPPKNTPVETETGRGHVINTQILTQLVSVRYEDGKIEAVPLEDIKILKAGKPGEKKDNSPKKPQQENAGGKNRGRNRGRNRGNKNNRQEQQQKPQPKAEGEKNTAPLDKEDKGGDQKKQPEQNTQPDQNTQPKPEGENNKTPLSKEDKGREQKKQPEQNTQPDQNTQLKPEGENDKAPLNEEDKGSDQNTQSDQQSNEE